jgi:demethylmenaquinone methyltransferase/2-methoxy-6-polyprenyl-1,4-benzoquinol methylase
MLAVTGDKLRQMEIHGGLKEPVPTGRAPSVQSAVPPPIQSPSFHAGDAMRLPIADASVDVVSIAFGIRNVAQPERAVAEFYRVLRPGGRLVILEFSLPRNRVLRGLYNFYFKHIMPRTATLIARDKSGAYKYLPRSVNTFINRETLTAMMRDAGFTDLTQRPLTFGIAVIYRGVKR